MNNQTIPQQIERLDTDRLRAYSESLGFYAGGQWAGRSRRKERRLTFNYARSFVDKITSYLMADIGFTIDPYDDSDDAALKAEEADRALAASTRTTTFSSWTSIRSWTPPFSGTERTRSRGTPRKSASGYPHPTSRASSSGGSGMT